MRIKIDTSALLGALQSCKAIATGSGGQSMPILKHVLMHVSDGRLTVTATDLTITARHVVECEMIKPGDACVSAKALADIVGTFKKGKQELALEVLDNHWLKVSRGRDTFSLMGSSAKDFPEPDKDERVNDSDWQTVDAASLRAMIADALPAVSEDEARVNLCGALLEIEGGKAIMASTDGHRLTKIEAPTTYKGTAKAIIPRRGLVEIHKMLGSGDVAVAINGKRIHVDIAEIGVSLIVKLNNVTFPPYRQVIPKSHAHVCTVDRDEIIGALQRAEVMAPEKTATVRLEIGDGSLKLTADNPDLGVAHQEIDAAFTGKTFAAGFNAKYLIEACERVNSPRVDLLLSGALDPCVVQEAGATGEPAYLCVVMPMRI
jgi:DNA polymerase-3 subunit beta